MLIGGSFKREENGDDEHKSRQVAESGAGSLRQGFRQPQVGNGDSQSQAAIGRKPIHAL